MIFLKHTRSILVLSLVLLCLFGIFMTPNAFAAECAGKDGFVPLECFSGSAKLSDTYTNTEDLGQFLNKLFVGAIVIGAILAVLRIAWAGFVYLGSDLWSNKEQAKEIIRDSLLGLFLLLAIWLILNQINPDILKLNVDSIKNNPIPALDDRITPNRSIPDDTLCTIPNVGPGIMQDGTCRFAPTRH